MKNRSTFFTMVLILVVIRLFSACEQSTIEESEGPGELVPGVTLEDKLEWLVSHAASNKEYSIVVDAYYNIDPHDL